MVPCKDGEFEWTATVLNINAGHNEELMSKCSILREYAIMVSKIKEFLAESLELKDAMAHWKEDFYEEGEQHGLEV